jgi:hypothetical protein
MRNSFCSRVLLGLIAAVAFLLPAHAQGPTGETSTGAQAPSLPDAPKPAQSVPQYHPPSSADRWHEYFFDAFGPIAIGRAAIGGAILQLRNTPPDWRQGAGPFAQRVASQYGLAMLNYTAEYGVGAVLRQDMKYYRCVCNGVLPRVGHAARMTLAARKGEDGHHVFSVPKLIAPYAATMGELTWYPARYGPKDALRDGNYSLLENFGTNIAREFIHFLVLKSDTDKP